MKVSIEGKRRIIKGVEYAPGLVRNLICIGHLVQDGRQVVFSNGVCEIKSKEGQVLL